MNWETLISFGDSITFGARSYLGYPEICGEVLGKRLHKKWHVINHATNGHTTMDLIRSINPVMENYKNSFPGIITVMIGTNDVKTHVNTPEFVIAYKQLIIKLKLISVNNNIVLLKIPPLTKKVFYPYNYSMNEKIKEFNSCIDALGKKENIRCFELNLKDEDFFDGVHLSTAGCYTAAEQLSEYILKDKGFEGTSNM